MTTPEGEKIKNEILELVREYYNTVHRAKKEADFIPGKTRVHYAGRVFDSEEMVNLVDASLDFWLTAGPYSAGFEKKMRGFFNAGRFLIVNSGSSANLILMSALVSQQFEERLKPGDEVITTAVTFPTTLTPIIQNGLVPVFVDAEVGTYNIDPSKIEDAVGSGTRAIFVPHTLGNPCNMDVVMDVADRKNLIVLEDCCDALGSKLNGKLAGTFGALSSLSFYPAHHITMGEGGGVIVNDPRFSKIALSLRDWGRDCWCGPGEDNSCSRRFEGSYGALPQGYDHKYVYSNLGYNLKVTDMQAAVGLAQLDKLEQFVKARKDNFNYLYEKLKRYEDKLVLPRWESGADPAWFGLPLTVRDGVDINKLVAHLEGRGIETRKLFAGNILKQPGFMHVDHRISGELVNTDIIMDSTFFIGVYPGLNDDMKGYIIESFDDFFKGE